MSQRSVSRAHRRRLNHEARRSARLRRLGLAAGAAIGSSTLAASAAQADDFVVTTTADSATTMRAEGDLTLRDAVLAANATAGADTITFASGLSGTLRLTGGVLEVAPGGLTITGPGSTVLSVSGDANDDGAPDAGDSRHFLVDEGAALTLSGLTLTEGTSPEFSSPKYFSGGGSIVVRSTGALDLRDAAITASTTDSIGGAILTSGDTTVVRSTFSGNASNGPGGAIAHSGQIAFGDRSTRAETRPGYLGALTIEDSSFTGNAGFFGGAVARTKYAPSDSVAPLTVTGSTFAGNLSVAEGGALHVADVAPSQPASIARSAFTGNTAGIGNSTSGGGAIVLGGSGAGTAAIDASTLAGNTAGGDGGALLVRRPEAAETTITRSTLTANTAGGSGALALVPDGALRLRGARAVAPTSTGVTLDGLTLSANTAEIAAGGLFVAPRSVDDPESDLDRAVPRTQVVTGTILAGNTVGDSGSDLGHGTVDDEDPDGGFVLRHSLVQAPGEAQTTTDPSLPSLIGVDPLLQALADNGGPTATMLPTAASPAVDAGLATTGVTTDQRGLARTADQADVANATGGDGTDIGAVERALPATPEPEPTPSPAPAPPAAAVPPAPAPALPAAGTSAIALPLTPISRPAVVRRARQPLVLRGTAGKGTTKVRVSVAKKVGSKCQFLLSSGRFSAQRDCRRTLYVTAEGTTVWKLTLPVLSKGRYTIWSRAIVPGRLELKKTTQNFRRFEIR